MLIPPPPLTVSEEKLTVQARKEVALRRRRALLSAGLRTYTYRKRRERDAILCLCCGLDSPNSSDVAYRWCPFCNVFHDDPFEVEA